MQHSNRDHYPKQEGYQPYQRDYYQHNEGSNYHEPYRSKQYPRGGFR